MSLSKLNDVTDRRTGRGERRTFGGPQEDLGDKASAASRRCASASCCTTTSPRTTQTGTNWMSTGFQIFSHDAETPLEKIRVGGGCRDLRKQKIAAGNDDTHLDRPRRTAPRFSLIFKNAWREWSIHSSRVGGTNPPARYKRRSSDHPVRPQEGSWTALTPP